MPNLTEERLNKAIEDARFSGFEILGFSTNPKLALLAGAAIGYQIGIEDTEEIISKIISIIKEEKL